jgi:hypothetical protein
LAGRILLQHQNPTRSQRLGQRPPASHEFSGLARLEPELGACLTAQFPTVSVRLNCLLSLAQLQGVRASHITKLRKFRDKAGSLADRRNRIAHDPWFFGFETKKLYRLQKTARAKLEFNYKYVTEDELNELEAEIVSTMDRFRDLRAQILREFYSLP